jgi:hypothetical protein
MTERDIKALFSTATPLIIKNTGPSGSFMCTLQVVECSAKTPSQPCKSINSEWKTVSRFSGDDSAERLNSGKLLKKAQIPIALSIVEGYAQSPSCNVL